MKRNILAEHSNQIFIHVASRFLPFLPISLPEQELVIFLYYIP